VLLADINDYATYENNVEAEAEAEAAAQASSVSGFATAGTFTAMTEDGAPGGGSSCLMTNLTEPFYITSVMRDGNGRTSITWGSCPMFRYVVYSADELSTNTTWLTQAYVWGQANATTWTDATTTNANVTQRFYKVKRILGNQLAASASHSLAALTNGLLFAWGNNDEGQLGLGPGWPTTIAFPAEVFGSVCTGLISNTVAVAGGGGDPSTGEGGYSIAADSNGVVWTWGWNNSGQLGNCSENDQAAPSPITGVSNVVSVAAGIAHTLALRADETVWAWGDNGYGELGMGGPTSAFTNSPVQSIGLTQIVAIAAGGSHSVALDQNGNVWTWGDNYSGQLGLGAGGPSSYTTVPTLVSNLPNAIAIAGGYQHTIALTSDTRVWTWGDNSWGQLGLGTNCPSSSTSVPTMVPTISNVVAIAGGDSFTLAVTSNGYVYGWGNNGSGQLGVYTGTLSQTSSPMLIAGISNAVLVSAPPQQSGRHCLAVTIAGGTNQYWAWGNSYYGQVGNGVTNQSFSYPCGPDICTSNNDSNVYAPAGPLQFPISYATCVQLGTSGSFTAPFTGTLTLYFNDNIYGDNTNGYTVTIEPFGQTYVPGTNAQGVAIGTVSNGVAYTYTASGWVNINNPHDPNDDADPNGNGHSQQPLGCRSEDPCTFTCPDCHCYSLVGKITSQ
jgi:alpha-tubulin suppressor-like RCC1 family protein